MPMFVIPEECREVMGWQVTQFKTNPNAPWEISEAEADLYWDVIENIQPRVILDLGCGLGRVAAYISQRLQGEPYRLQHRVPGTSLPVSPLVPWPPGTRPRQPTFILADSTGSSPLFTRSIGGWQSLSKMWHNDLDLTRKFAEANGVKGAVVDICRGLDEVYHEDGPAVAISMLSVGFHFAIEPYLDILRRQYDAVILGIRKGQYKLKDLRQVFAGFKVDLRSSGALPKYDIMVAVKE
jgi:hypothetical protein